jgi:hypothetical protein
VSNGCSGGSDDQRCTNTSENAKHDEELPVL